MDWSSIILALVIAISVAWPAIGNVIANIVKIGMLAVIALILLVTFMQTAIFRFDDMVIAYQTEPTKREALLPIIKKNIAQLNMLPRLSDKEKPLGDTLLDRFEGTNLTGLK